MNENELKLGSKFSIGLLPGSQQGQSLPLLGAALKDCAVCPADSTVLQLVFLIVKFGVSKTLCSSGTTGHECTSSEAPP